MKAFLVGKTKLNQRQPENTHKSIFLAVNYQKNTNTPFLHKWRDHIEVGRAETIHRAGYQKFLKEIQQEIAFKYIKITKPFDGTEITEHDGNLTADWESLFEVYDFILGIRAEPFLVLESDKYSDAVLEIFLEEFLYHAVIMYGEDKIRAWRFCLTESLEKSKRIHVLMERYGLSIYKQQPRREVKNYLYDTAYMVPYFIHHILKNTQPPLSDAPSVFDTNSDGYFSGERGLITNGLKKPLYQAHILLSHLGNQLLEIGENYIVTKKYGDLQILLWNYAESVESLQNNDLNLNLSNRYTVFVEEEPMDVAIQITGLNGAGYILKELSFDRAHGCLYDMFHDVEVMRFLSKSEKDKINDMCTMKATYNYIHGKKDVTLKYTLKENGACVIYLKKTKEQCIASKSTNTEKIPITREPVYD